MTNRTVRIFIGCLAALFTLSARAEERARKDDKGTFLGVLCGPRKEAPSTTSTPTTGTTTDSGKTGTTVKTAQGVVVTHVLPDSPAAKADLRRGDILLQYDRQAIRDGDHLARLIQADKPSRKVQLVYQRGDQVKTAEATLTLGPALRLSNDPRSAELPKGSVSVWAAPLASGKWKVAIEYHAHGKRQTLTCEGADAELAETLRKLPERERNLVRIALQRLRTLNTLPPPRKETPSPVKR
jgi:hypothetical protein